MPNVRPELLRRFYDAAWHGSVPPERLYDGATFEEYYALERVRYPEMSRNTAAKSAPFEAFRALASTYPPEPPRAIPALKNVHLARRPTLDLNDESIANDVERLVLDRIKAIAGWSSLSRLTRLRALLLVLSGTDGAPGSPLRAELHSLEVLDCKSACLRAALVSTSARSVSFSLPEGHLHLALLEGHANLRELTAGASLVRGTECVARWPLIALDVGMVEVDSALREGVAALTGSLERLSVTSRSAFPPEALPDLAAFSKLRRVRVGVHGTAFCKEWVDYAVARPAIDFVFAPLADAPTAQGASLEEVYRGIDILRVAKGKNVMFEVSGDLAPELDAQNNAEVEERLEPLAKSARKKVVWSSEADTFVAQSKDVATCHWLIDTIHDLSGRG
jgi:hypothetical protein